MEVWTKVNFGERLQQFVGDNACLQTTQTYACWDALECLEKLREAFACVATELGDINANQHRFRTVDGFYFLNDIGNTTATTATAKIWYNAVATKVVATILNFDKCAGTFLRCVHFVSIDGWNTFHVDTNALDFLDDLCFVCNALDKGYVGNILELVGIFLRGATHHYHFAVGVEFASASNKLAGLFFRFGCDCAGV